MGRGAYDNTDASQSKSSAAQCAISAHHTAQAEAERKAEAEQAVADEAKLIRSKKSRGILAARRAAKQQDKGAPSSTKTPSEVNKEQVVKK